MPTETLIDDDARAAQRHEAKRLEAIDAHQEFEDLQAVLGTVQGRRLIWRIIRRTGVLDTAAQNAAPQPGHPRQPIDPLALAYQDGARSMGVRWLRIVLEQFPVRLTEMAAEGKR